LAMISHGMLITFFRPSRTELEFVVRIESVLFRHLLATVGWVGD
jgi:hypothetical protein